MLQIIGWLGCAMLAVKLLEMTANPAMQNETGGPKASFLVALLVGWASVFGFAFLLFVQGSAFESPSLLTDYGYQSPPDLLADPTLP